LGDFAEGIEGFKSIWKQRRFSSDDVAIISLYFDSLYFLQDQSIVKAPSSKKKIFVKGIENIGIY
jgi:hypothetical protein